MPIYDIKDIGHAARAAEGRAKWMAEWKVAWTMADEAAVSAESHAVSRVEIRHRWATKIAEARDMSPPKPDDAVPNDQFLVVWNLAWGAAWDAAIAASHVSLDERDRNELSGLKKWDRGGRAERAAAGLAAGAEAWNETYRAEVKERNL